MHLLHAPGPRETATLDTAGLRAAFLLEDLFQPGRITARYTDLDRMVIGAALPAEGALALEGHPLLGTACFLERREIGILNLGSPGRVMVGGATFALGSLDCLYIGLGEREVRFENAGHEPAAFYFVSAPAHAKHPTAVARHADARTAPIGEVARANRRRINKYIHPEGIRSCQLTMGFTEFEPGSVWNTMPPHTHSRRSEAYLYFDLGDNLVVHLLGEPHATRHVIVRDRQAVLSPSWSLHCGAGTGSYRFVWAMAGDNQAFSDMDAVAPGELR